MKLFFREEGIDGTPVVILHGLFGSADNWISVGKKLSMNHRVYLVDQRNHGRSPHHRVHTYEAMKEDLAEFLTTQNIDKAIVIGHSMGGKTAMLFAADYPEMIEKLVVVDIAPRSYLVAGKKNLAQQKRILESLKEMEKHNGQLAAREDQVAFLEAKLGSKTLAQFLLKSIDRDRETGHFKFRLNIDALYNSLEEMVGGVNENCFCNRMPVTGFPVLFIKGERSDYISEEDIPLIQKIYPEAQLERVSGAGHWVQSDQPDLFMEILQNFLG